MRTDLPALVARREPPRPDRACEDAEVPLTPCRPAVDASPQRGGLFPASLG
jgi:hypothetical protein